MKTGMRKYLFLLTLAFTCTSLLAQDTSSFNQAIKITSSYKPNLRDVVKIDLAATPLEADTSRPKLAYSIPPQNLFFSYSPVVLQPGTVAIDTSVLMGTRNYVKGGFGTYRTPYLEGALTYGDGKESLLKIYGDFTSSHGKIKNQDYSKLNIRGDGSIFTGDNEVYGSLGFGTTENYWYGYDHDIFDFEKSDIRRRFRDMDLTLGVRNIQENDLGITYDPHITLHGYTRENNTNESTLSAWLPAVKSISDNVKVKLTIFSDVNGYKQKATDLKLTKTLVEVRPVVEYSGDIFNLKLGLTPAWNEGESKLLPNLYGDLKLDELDFTLQGGWIGKYKTNSFRTLSNYNPFIDDPVVLHNTKEMQYFGGIKGSLGGHFNYNAKLSYITYDNMPLYMNNPATPWKFDVVNESTLHNFQIHGDLNFINQDLFTLTAGVDINSYSGLTDNDHTWGLYPFKLTGSLRWKVIPDFTVKGDLAAFSGAKAFVNGEENSLKGGTDLSIGAEYKINKMFSAWLDFNNLLNDQYQYWYNYPVLGLQAIGGVIVRF